MDLQAPVSSEAVLDRFRIVSPGLDPNGLDPNNPADRREAPGTPEGAQDSVLLSPEARALADETKGRRDDGQSGAEDSRSPREATSADAEARPGELTEEEEQQVQELRDRDREVRAHENAHKAAAGGLARGGPVYEYQTGPDGRRYAVGGHVNIAVGEGRTPEETLQNATQARRAALAPAEPSGQDRAVAAQAAQLAAEARQQISEERRQAAEEAQGSDSESNGIATAEVDGSSSPAAVDGTTDADESESRPTSGNEADTADSDAANATASLLGLAIDAYSAATRGDASFTRFGLVG